MADHRAVPRRARRQPQDPDGVLVALVLLGRIGPLLAWGLVLVLLLAVGVASRAEAQPRRPAPAMGSRMPRMLSTTAAVGVETGRARPYPARRRIDPALVRRVLGSKPRLRASVIESPAAASELPLEGSPLDEDELAKKELRLKVTPGVIGFPTGGGGVKLKFRY